jgi:hypothetical protein
MAPEGLPPFGRPSSLQCEVSRRCAFPRPWSTVISSLGAHRMGTRKPADHLCVLSSILAVGLGTAEAACPPNLPDRLIFTFCRDSVGWVGGFADLPADELEGELFARGSTDATIARTMTRDQGAHNRRQRLRARRMRKDHEKRPRRTHGLIGLLVHPVASSAQPWLSAAASLYLTANGHLLYYMHKCLRARPARGKKRIAVRAYLWRLFVSARMYPHQDIRFSARAVSCL